MNLEDRVRGEEIMRLLAPGAQETWGVVLDGDPHSKARPRFSKKDGRAYKDPLDEAAEQATKWKMRAWWKRGPLTGNVAVGCMFFRSTRQEIDADNMLKHVCDAGNGLLWVDDSQITAQYAGIQLDRERPRTILVVGRHVSTMRRGTDALNVCFACGETFQPKLSTQECCSRACANKARSLKRAAAR